MTDKELIEWLITETEDHFMYGRHATGVKYLEAAARLRELADDNEVLRAECKLHRKYSTEGDLCPACHGQSGSGSGTNFVTCSTCHGNRRDPSLPNAMKATDTRKALEKP